MEIKSVEQKARLLENLLADRTGVCLALQLVENWVLLTVVLLV
jgi:hypothetical protein